MSFTRFSDFGISCAHPKRVFNKYTREWICVPCRHCGPCEKSSSNRLISLINNAAAASACTYFGTLTYSSDNLPIVSFDFDKVIKGATVTSFDYRSHRSLISHFDFALPLSLTDRHFFNLGMPSLSDSSFLGSGRFGCLVKSDLQKFFKRFRKLFNYAFPSSSFKYFAVGEYGSRTFRPHYHFLFFVSDVLPFSELSRLVRLSWKSGFVDFQVSKGRTASYLSSYLSCSSPLPVFLKEDFLRPFYVHSAFSSFALTSDQEKKYFESAYFERCDQHLTESPDGFNLVPFSAPFRNRLFPKPSRFSERTDYEVCRILQLYASKKVGDDEPLFCVPCRVLTFQSLCHNRLEGIPEYNVVNLNLSLTQLRDASLPADSKFKRNIKVYLLDNRDYIDIYASYKVWKISKLLGTSPFFVASRIIDFYRGSSNHYGKNFELQKLSLQYSSLSLADNIDEVKFLYSFFNGPSAPTALAASGFEPSFFPSEVLDKFVSLADEHLFKSIKHKDVNSYYQYKLHH